MILNLIEQIGEALGRLDENTVRANVHLRRINRIRAIQGSLAIEGNTLSEDEISTVLDGKPVIAPLREVQEARNAIKVYGHMPHWRPARQEDLLEAHEMLIESLFMAR